MTETLLPGIPLIVLGMGRSGTSYLASLLRSSGIHLGDDLISASDANPRGFFEDREIVAFHQELLKRARQGDDWDDTAGPLVSKLDLTADEQLQAVAILKRLARTGVWGWKDPRTIHFIEFWLTLLPQAKILVPLRHPLELLYSYLKRVATFGQWHQISRVLSAYAEYHEYIYRLLQHSPNSLVIYSQNAFRDLAGLHVALKQLLNVTDNEVPVNQLPFQRMEFTRLRIDSSVADLFDIVYPEAATAFKKLNACAQFPFRPEDPLVTDHFPIIRLIGISDRFNSIDRKSWLPILVDISREDTSPGYFELQSRMLIRRTETEKHWKTQVSCYRDELGSFKTVNQEQAEWIDQLKTAKEYAESQLASLQQEAESRMALIEKQRAWISELEVAKKFAENDAACHHQELQSYKALLEEQTAWISALKAAKEFAENQTNSHKQEVNSCVALIQEQASWIKELKTAKEFAETTAVLQKKELDSCMALIQEQAAWIKELKTAKEFAENQASGDTQNRPSVDT